MDALHPEAEVHIDDDLVRALLHEQHPDLAGETLARVDAGWDNVTYRVGGELAIRIPRRETAVALLLNEQRWLPVLGPRLGIAVPLPTRSGVPSGLFKWPWSIVKWVPGQTVDSEPMAPGQAAHLAEVLRALHQDAPEEAPTNPFRGIPLRLRHEFVVERVQGLPHVPGRDLGTLTAFWEAGLAAPEASEAVWIHGDLHPRNVLAVDGRLTGIIDWGDVCSGDPATDLACAWMLFRSAEARSRLWQGYEPSHDVVVRARAWAVFFASALSTSGEPRHESIGHTILANLLNA
jgi:aminoglycoside phosphotransferase (APT) family kinase protein